jgi:predicted double-glycine peptidase
MSRSGREPARGLLRLLAVSAAALLASGCSTTPLAEGQGMMRWGGSLDFALPVTSVIGRRFETVVRQQYDFSCGSAALATLLRYHYEDPQDEQSVFLGMWRNGDQPQIRKLGFSLLDTKRYLAERGIAADGYKVSVEQIARAATPGIALVNYNGYRHFVVVKGVDDRTLLLGDPSLGLRRETIAQFAKQWNGIFFVLNGRSDVARTHFNQPRDLARAPGFHAFSGIRPLSLAGLSLTRPLPGDF